MGIFDLFWKKTGNVGKYEFRDEDRETSLKYRQEKAEIRRIQLLKERAIAEAELEDVREEIAERRQPDLNNPDKMMMELIQKIMGAAPGQAAPDTKKFYISGQELDMIFPYVNVTALQKIKNLVKPDQVFDLLQSRGMHEETIKGIINYIYK